jgi:hypothetical protein
MTSFITIRNLTGQEISVHVTPGITVMQVKKLVEEKNGIPASCMRLIYNGQQLRNSRILNDNEVEFTLADYEVPMEGATVHMVQAMR